MDPEIWGMLPPDILERIAHFADIDSRRAMGFLPRRLVLPDLDIPCRTNEYVEFNRGISRFIKLRNAKLYVCQDETAWQFGKHEDFMKTITYCFRRDGVLFQYGLGSYSRSRHPDFNEDGTFNRLRPLDNNALLEKSVASEPRL
jgi:hypothetical protein